MMNSGPPHRRGFRAGLVSVVAAVAASLLPAAGADAADRLYWTNGLSSNNTAASWVALDASSSGNVSTGAVSVDRAFGLGIDLADDRLYWTELGGQRIGSADLDGANAATVPTPGASFACANGGAIDPAGGKYYWASACDTPPSSLQFANLDGSGGGTLGTGSAPLSRPSGVAVDPATNRIYWVNSLNQPGAFLSNLDGTGNSARINVAGANPIGAAGVAVDPIAGRVYFPNQGGGGLPGFVSYANLDGSGGGVLNTTGATVPTNPAGIAVDPEAGRVYWASTAPNRISAARTDGSGGFDLPTLGAISNRPSYPAIVKKPAGVGLPVVSGSETVGSTLRCSPGAWADDILVAHLYRVPTSFDYGWLRDGEEIAGATARSVVADVPGAYECLVTARNVAGATSQRSVAVTVAREEPTPVIPSPTPVVPVSNDFTIGAVRANKKTGTATVPVTIPGPGLLGISGRDISGQFGEVGAGNSRLIVRASGRARRTLRRKGRVTVRATITFGPSGGTPARKDLPVRLRLPK